MANSNAPFGLRLIGRQNDATPSFQLGPEPLQFASNNNVVIAKGDVLKRVNTGFVTAFTGAIGSTAATGRDLAAGIFAGCEYLSNSLGRRVPSPTWPGGDTSYDVDVQYIPLTGYPNARFVAQTLLTSAAFADIGQNVDIAYAAPTVYGGWSRSNVTIDMGSALSANPGLPFRIVGLWSQFAPSGSPGTDDASNYNWVVVEFNGANEAGI
jgi:hypothetical protein